MRETARVFDVAGQVIAIGSRHPGVGKHDVGRILIEHLESLSAVVGCEDANPLLDECKGDHALNRRAVVDEQQRRLNPRAIGSKLCAHMSLSALHLESTATARRRTRHNDYTRALAFP